MYDRERTLSDIGAYDDYTLMSGNGIEGEGEGFFSPFTYLCFALILLLFGLVILFSSSYDTALRSGEKFYHYFLVQTLVTLISLVAGAAVSFVPLRTLKRTYFILIPVYTTLVILSMTTGVLNSVCITQSIGLLCNVTLLFLLSHTVGFIKDKENNGLWLIAIITLTVFMLLSESLVAGLGWYLLSSFIIISVLYSQRVRLSYIFFFVLTLIVIFVLETLYFPSILSEFGSSIFPVDSSLYYNSDLYQAQNAILEGGMIGVGLGNGLYKLGIIRDISGIYIYASIVEEVGVSGSLLIIIPAIMILIIGIRTSQRAYKRGEKFISSFTLGSAVLLTFSMIINMLYVSGLSPFYGVPLLLFSYNPICQALIIVIMVLLYKFIFRIGREKE